MICEPVIHGDNVCSLFQTSSNNITSTLVNRPEENTLLSMQSPFNVFIMNQDIDVLTIRYTDDLLFIYTT